MKSSNPDASRGALSPAEPGDLIVADTSIVGLAEHDTDLMWDRMAGRADARESNQLDLICAAGRRRSWAKRGVRQFLTEKEGRGYWDFFKPSDHFQVSVTAATYAENTWVRVEGERYFKLRVLLSGKLLGAQGDPLISGPQAVVFLSPGAGRDGYFIARDLDTRMVVLHCRSEFLTDTLGVAVSAVPPPFDRLYGPPQPGSLHRVALGPEVLHAAQRIVDSRHELPGHLRAPFLEAMAMDIICQVLGDLSNGELVRRSESQFSARDLNRIYEARDYLSQHFAAPPLIPQLARMVGINQTKLKAGFKQVFGVTIYDYVLQRRMERASELLIARNYAVAEVGYMVGYEHAANFTCAFKKHFGCLPRAWKHPHSR